MAGGQPTKCTPELTEKIGNYIRNGVAIKYASEACGISADAFYMWMRLGRKESEEGNTTPYATFFNTIAAIRAEFVQEAIQMIKKAGRTNKNWQANTWLLEKLYTAGYGKDSMEVQQLSKDIEEIKRILGAEFDPSNAHTQSSDDDKED